AQDLVVNAVFVSQPNCCLALDAKCVLEMLEIMLAARDILFGDVRLKARQPLPVMLDQVVEKRLGLFTLAFLCVLPMPSRGLDNHPTGELLFPVRCACTQPQSSNQWR